MDFSDLMFDDSDFLNKNIASLPDRPRLSAADLKAMFDMVGQNLIALGKFNELLELLGEVTAEDIPADVDGLGGEDISTLLASVKLALDDTYSISQVDDRLDLKLNVSDVADFVENISFNSSTGVFTITKNDGSTATIDTAIEKIAVNAKLEGTDFVLVLGDGTEQRVALSSFVNVYNFLNTPSIAFSTSTTDGVVSVAGSIRDGAVTENMLSADVLQTVLDLEEYATEVANAALSSATAAAESAATALEIQEGSKTVCWYPTVTNGVLTWEYSTSRTSPAAYVVKGETGAKGDTGEQGLKGDTGEQGEQGPRGIQGEQGETGAKGDGLNLLAMYATLGELETAHAVGSAGDYYAVGTSESNLVYFWDTEELSWTCLGELQGAKGDTGEQGAQGVAGQDGADGQDGQDGLTTSITMNGETIEQVDGNIDLGDIATISDQLDMGRDGIYLGNQSRMSFINDFGVGASIPATREIISLGEIAGMAGLFFANITDIEDMHAAIICEASNNGSLPKGVYLLNKTTDVPTMSPIATESYVASTVGEINNLLDNINGEVI